LSVLTRYLTREFVRLFILCLAGGVTLFLVIDLFDRAPRFLNYGGGFKWVVLYFLYKMPSMVYHMIPAAMLLSVLLTLGLMARYNEILALRTSGIPVWRIAYPFMLFSILVSLGAFWLSEYVVSPTVQRSQYIWKVCIKGGTPSSLMVRNRIWFKGEEGIYRIATFLPARNELQGVTLFQIDRPFRLAKRIDAARAKWEDYQWIFSDVEERTFGAEGKGMEMVSLSSQQVDLNERPEDFRAIDEETHELPISKLKYYIEKIKAEGYDPTPYQIEIHRRVAYPFVNIFTVFLGIPFALRLSRQWGLAVGIVISMVLGFSYWTLFAITISLGKSGLLAPLPAAWAANILFGTFGLYLFLRVEEKAHA